MTSIEEENQKKYREWAKKSIANAVDPSSGDFINWDEGDQPLVDAAFLVFGILQAKEQLWNHLDEDVKPNFCQAITRTRKIAPWRSNWILFSAMIEVFLYEISGEVFGVKSVIDYGISQFEQWYVGDGFYKDGDNFHFDYYESIVIHPFLLEFTRCITWIDGEQKYRERALKYFKILTSFIGDDGCYPAIGRSLCYRDGLFHLLAKMATDNEFDVDMDTNIKNQARIWRFFSPRVQAGDYWRFSVNHCRHAFHWGIGKETGGHQYDFEVFVTLGRFGDGVNFYHAGCCRRVRTTCDALLNRQGQFSDDALGIQGVLSGATAVSFFAHRYRLEI